MACWIWKTKATEFLICKVWDSSILHFDPNFWKLFTITKPNVMLLSSNNEYSLIRIAKETYIINSWNDSFENIIRHLAFFVFRVSKHNSSKLRLLGYLYRSQIDTSRNKFSHFLVYTIYTTWIPVNIAYSKLVFF